MQSKNVLLIGSGARESAILSAVLNSSLLKKCFFSGVVQFFSHNKLEITRIDTNNNDDILTFCRKNNIDFVICGPELPLCNGIVDFLENNGIAIYGPNKMASQLESSKIFMKDVLSKAGVPTAKYQTFTLYELEDAKNFILTFPGKIVIKTDGLASGKGVYICEDHQSAITVLQEFFDGKFGDAGKSVVIEEFFDGKEVSVFALCDGKTAIPFYHACDYKKIGDGDTGLNTGGMGSYAPSFLKKDEFESIVNQYFNATLNELQKRGIQYKGFLFGGLIITNEGIKFLEYNIRMGDPETQSIIPLLDCDFLEVLLKSYNGNLRSEDIKLLDKSAVTVVLASQGYPEDFEKNKEITGFGNVTCSIFPAGIYEKSGKFFTNGGRVLSITAVANSKKEARNNVYENLTQIIFDGMYYRKDIAK